LLSAKTTSSTSLAVPGTEKEISEIDSQFDGNSHQAPPEFYPGALFHVLYFSQTKIPSIAHSDRRDFTLIVLFPPKNLDLH
jgi:hypothetical protein